MAIILDRLLSHPQQRRRLRLRQILLMQKRPQTLAKITAHKKICILLLTELQNHCKTITMLKLQHAKSKLKAGGWSYRSAGPALGVTYSYLSHVLNGKFQSRRLLVRIETLPTRAEYEARRPEGKAA